MRLGLFIIERSVMELNILIQTSLYFLALINPASKVFILSTVRPPYSTNELLKVSVKASFVAMVILLILSAVGHIVLKSIFQVEIYSLRIAGGVVLFIIGLAAVRNGRFYERKSDAPADDISIVPLAAPLIAGPGTITAAISFSSTHGIPITMISLTIAVAINFLIMLSSVWIGKTLERFHAFGPLIRITGLVVAAVAVQMILTGVSEWLTVTLAAAKH
jgi:multiple antibiotic resistance protein